VKANAHHHSVTRWFRFCKMALLNLSRVPMSTSEYGLDFQVHGQQIGIPDCTSDAGGQRDGLLRHTSSRLLQNFCISRPNTRCGWDGSHSTSDQNLSPIQRSSLLVCLSQQWRHRYHWASFSYRWTSLRSRSWTWRTQTLLTSFRCKKP